MLPRAFLLRALGAAVLLAGAPALAQAAIITPSGFLFDEVAGGPGYRQSVTLGHTPTQVKRVLGRPAEVKTRDTVTISSYRYPTRTIEFTGDERVRFLQTSDRRDTIGSIPIVGRSRDEILETVLAAGFRCKSPTTICTRLSATARSVILLRNNLAQLVRITSIT
jgi:hypothetical protein